MEPVRTCRTGSYQFEGSDRTKTSEGFIRSPLWIHKCVNQQRTAFDVRRLPIIDLQISQLVNGRDNLLRSRLFAAIFLFQFVRFQFRVLLIHFFSFVIQSVVRDERLIALDL